MGQRRLAWVGVLLTVAVQLAACSDSNGLGDSLDGRIRYVNALKFATGTVQIGLIGGPSSVVSFAGVSAYEGVGPGRYTVEVRDENGPIDISGIVSISTGTDHTLAIIGQPNFANGMAITDDCGEPPAGQAFVRIANGGPQTGPVDVYVLQPGEQVEGNPTVGELDWLIYTEECLAFASGELSLVLTDVGQPESVRYESGLINVPPGAVRTFLIIDADTELDEIELIVLEDDE